MAFQITVEAITPPVQLGEGPHWDEQQACLYYVSILEHTVHKYCPETNQHTTTKFDGPASFIVPVEGTIDKFVVGLEQKFVVIEWDGTDGNPAKVVQELFEVDEELPGNNINDGKVDPRGRVYAGSMRVLQTKTWEVEKEKGSLYCVEGSKKITKLESSLTISNGLAWDLNEKAFYFIDSRERNIRRYDYDVETGKISNMTRIFDFVKHGIGGIPDGMTIDIDGNLWVAVFNGSCVLNLDPRTGKLIRKISLPAEQITSVTFGGPNLDILYVTSARITIDKEPEELWGSVFKVTGLGVKGGKNYSFKLE